MEVMTKYNEAQVDFRERSKGRIQRQLEISACLKFRGASSRFPVTWLSAPVVRSGEKEQQPCLGFHLIFCAQARDTPWMLVLRLKVAPCLSGPNNFVFMQASVSYT